MAQRSGERNLNDIHTLDEALARALHDSGRRTETVAGEIGVRRAYLSDALNPDRDEMQFQARLLITFCRSTASMLPIAWLADQLGYVLVPREQATQSRDIAIETLDVADEAGQLSHAVRHAYADGLLSEQERSDIRAHAHRVQREAAEVVRAVSLSPVSLSTDRRPA